MNRRIPTEPAVVRDSRRTYEIREVPDPALDSRDTGTNQGTESVLLDSNTRRRLQELRADNTSTVVSAPANAE